MTGYNKQDLYIISQALERMRVDIDHPYVDGVITKTEKMLKNVKEIEKN